MQWQPGADLKGVTTVYPDIIPQYIPFDYDKLLAVESAKAKAKTAAQGKPPSTNAFTTALGQLKTTKIPHTLAVAVDENTGALIEVRNPARDEWDKYLASLGEIAASVETDPYSQPRVLAWMAGQTSKFDSLAEAQSATNELIKGYKEGNKSGLFDALNENTRYLDATKTDGDIFSYGQTSVGTPLDIREQMDKRFQQLPTEERQGLKEWETLVAPLGERFYMLPKESAEYRTQEKLKNSFNGMLGSEDIKNELSRQTNLKIHNYSFSWNNKSKAEKNSAVTMTDSEYNEKLTKLGSLQTEISKLSKDPKNTETVELLNKEYYNLQEDLYGKGASIIVDSKGNLAKDLMADQMYKIKVSNLYKEFIGAGSYEVDKRGIDVAASFYLSDYIRKNSEKNKEKDTDTPGIFSQPIVLESDVPFNPLKSSILAVEKSDSDKLYGSMPALVTQTASALNTNGVSSFVLDRLNKTYVNASDSWKRSVIDVFKKNPQALATMLSVYEVHKKTKGFFSSAIDPVLKTYLTQNTASILKSSSLDQILSWIDGAELSSVTEYSSGGNPSATKSLPSIYNTTLKQVEKDQTLMPNSLLFTSSSNSDKDPMKAMIGTINRATGLDATAFLLENGVDLKSQTTHFDEDKKLIRNYNPVNNGKFGEEGYYQLMSDVGSAAVSNADNNKHANLFTALSILGHSKSMSKINPGVISSLPTLMARNAKDIVLTKDGSAAPVKVSFSVGESGKTMTISYRGGTITKENIQSNEQALIELARTVLPSIPLK